MKLLKKLHWLWKCFWGRKYFITYVEELVEDYKVATNWSNYASQIKGLSELT